MTNAQRFMTILALVCCMQGRAQPVDSSYHNYLYDSRTAYFRQLPVTKGAVIFWGDSITQWGDWAEFTGFLKVLNRGIAGDNSYGLRARTDEITRHLPSSLFILIGTNDLNLKIPVANIIENYKKLIDQVRIGSPATKIFVQSVLPINNDLIGRQYYTPTNKAISALNTELKKMAADKGVNFVDVYPVLLDKQAQLDAKYTYDGLHLSGQGYLKWVEYLTEHHFL